MIDETLMSASCEAFDAASAAFYKRVLEVMNAAAIPFVVGGTYAQTCYTGEQRETKDLDIFIRRSDYERVSAVMAEAGYESEMAYPHWLGKIHSAEAFIDVIFSSGNGISEVDDLWFQHAADAQVLGVAVKISPVEEMIWSKAFIMERERYDGADVAHLLHSRADKLDWPRLLMRFDPHWRVLLSHLVLFGFIYPGEQQLIPEWVMDDLLERLAHEAPKPAQSRVCQGTLLSREQYLDDVKQQGYRDGRLKPLGNMSKRDVAHWTAAIPERVPLAAGEEKE